MSIFGVRMGFGAVNLSPGQYTPSCLTCSDLGWSMRSVSQVCMRLVGTYILSIPFMSPHPPHPSCPFQKAKGLKGQTCCKIQLLNISIPGQQPPQEWSGLLWRVIQENVSYSVDREVSTHFQYHFIHEVFICADFSASQRQNQKSNHVE